MATTTPKSECECMECGRKFKRAIGSRTTFVKCPKCGSEDIEVGF